MSKTMAEKHTGNGELAIEGVNGVIEAPTTKGRPKRQPAADRISAHLEALETKPAASAKPIVIPKLDIRTMRVRLVGDAPLIVHRFSEKAKKAMLGKQTGTPTEGREFKDPLEDFLGSLYRYPSGAFTRKADWDETRGDFRETPHCCFPAIGFKNSAVTACTSLGKSITKVQARQAFHVIGDMVEIHGSPTMREDTVKIGMGTTDLRYRGEFKSWSCELTIRYNARVLSDEQIINLLNVAGFAVGVGEWRPERDGQNGLFHVE